MSSMKLFSTTGGGPSGKADRVVSFGEGLAAIPERLLLAHARGEVLFIVGAGVSKQAKLADFRELVLGVYRRVDPPVHDVLSGVDFDACNRCSWSLLDFAGLTEGQQAEIRRFFEGDYDVVLGMVERRIDGQSSAQSSVRCAVANELWQPDVRPAPIHRALMRLADRGSSTAIITTNFEMLLEQAARRIKAGPVETYSLGAIPRPTRGPEFAGVFHIHGAFERKPLRYSDLILTDRDFGEFYLRRRIVPDFIYDAARLFNLVLVGYTANDPPMRYLLNAVAGDGERFTDLKERFAFVGGRKPDMVEMEDWKGRGITPIPYDSDDGHRALRTTLERWAAFSPNIGNRRTIDAAVKRIVHQLKADANDSDRDLFEHLVRRADTKERVRLAALATKNGASLDWLDTIVAVARARGRGGAE